MTNEEMFNCCVDFAEPDWRQYDGVEVHACRQEDGEVHQCAHGDAEFWCVFGHFPTGGLDAITDCCTYLEAAHLAKRFRISILHDVLKPPVPVVF